MLLIMAIAAQATDQGVTPTPCSIPFNLSASEVAARLMSRNAERARKLGQVESTRQYDLEYAGFPSGLSAHMRVKALYTAQGKKQFTLISESGSHILRNHVLHKLLDSEKEASSDEANRDAVAVTTENYDFSLLGCETEGNRTRYVMKVEPLHETKFLYRGKIWVDAQDFAVTQIEAEPAKNPSYWTKRSEIHHQYQKIGEFYFPTLNRTVTDARFGGRAVLTIHYLDYKLSQPVATGPETSSIPR
jgi:hypothetical protein